MSTINKFLDYKLISVSDYAIKGDTIFAIVIIYFTTHIILWLIKKLLLSDKRKNRLDEGNAYALLQIIRYVIWVISVSIILQTIGIKISVLIAGSAALLVGIGFGLQQTFNDIVSGIILLSERSIKVGDILEIDDDVVQIKKIGLRTSIGMDRDDISIILPNSMITTSKVINWSHQDKKTRFRIKVGVAYGSDVDLVIQVLEDSVFEHPKVLDKSLVRARFVEFNNSSLDFEVLFFSENIFRIENIKSDIRRIINKRFIEHGISIPFPQMDVHMKASE